MDGEIKEIGGVLVVPLKMGGGSEVKSRAGVYLIL